MAKALNFLILLAFAQVISSQEKPMNGYLDISTGLAMPAFEFKQVDNDYSSGFANFGIDMELEYTFFFSKFFGFNVSIAYYDFEYNTPAYEAFYENYLGETNSINIKAGNYRFIYPLVGICFQLPIPENQNITFSLQHGISLSYHPEIVVTHQEWGEINKLDKSDSFNAIGGGELKYSKIIDDKYGISVSYSLFHTKPEFEDNSGNYDSYKLPVTFQSFNIGFLIKML